MRAALSALKDLYIGRIRVAEDCRQAARRAEERAARPKKRRAEMEREVEETKAWLKVNRKDRAEYRNRLQSWGGGTLCTARYA